MKKEYLQPFLRASQDISERYFGVEVNKSDITFEQTMDLNKEVIIWLGIKGDLKGVALFGMDIEDAEKLSMHVLESKGLTKEQAVKMGMSNQEWRELVNSVLKEYGNQVVGFVTQLYGNDGLSTDITTPRFIRKEQLQSFKEDSVKFEMVNGIGNIVVKLHLKRV
jgi:chemotaxis protein CheX